MTDCQSRQSKVVKPDKTFRLSVHGIRWQKPKYYFKCGTGSCKQTFNQIKDLNLHHRLKHNMVLKNVKPVIRSTKLRALTVPTSTFMHLQSLIVVYAIAHLLLRVEKSSY